VGLRQDSDGQTTVTMAGISVPIGGDTTAAIKPIPKTDLSHF